MKAFGWEGIRDLLLLSFAAGGADAAGYMGLGRIFTSNMTGNVVLLGIAVGQGHFGQAARTLYVLAIFMSGAAAGTWLGAGTSEKDRPRLMLRLIGTEAALVALFAIGWAASAGSVHAASMYGLLTLLALAMGLQSATLNRLRAPGVATTAVTSTLTEMVTGAMKLFLAPRKVAEQDKPARGRVGFQALVLCLYCAGAGLTAVLMLHARLLVGCAPALILIFVILGQGSAWRHPGRDFRG